MHAVGAGSANPPPGGFLLAIVLKAREMYLAGATVLRGLMGIPATCTPLILRLSQDLPLVIEIVDSEEAISRFHRRDWRHDGERNCDHREGQGNPVRH